MSDYDTLKKIIPPDQALANKALSKSLQQVKKIFDTDLPSLASAVVNLETNKDLNLINALTEPVPAFVTNFTANLLAIGTGPNNTITTVDVIGIAAGNTVTIQMPAVVDVVTTLTDIGALDPLVGNGGTSSSSTNGVYTVMQYALGNAYTTDDGMGNVSITIPSPLPGQGTYGPDSSFGNVISNCFSNLISIANTAIINIASSYSTYALQANDASNAMATQLLINVQNSVAAGIDIGNVVNDISNADLQSNSISTVLSLASQLHDIGLDVTEGGAAEFFDAVANTSNLAGQAVVASMREGRNIALLNAVGIPLDTQLSDINVNSTVSNNISDGQYSVSQARANIIF